jgi:hypothetical protein
MQTSLRLPLALSALAVLALLTACADSAEDEPVPEPAPTEQASAPATTAAEPPEAAPDSSANVLTPDGLGPLVVGKPIPAGSSWAVRGAQASDTCLLASSPGFPNAYAIVEGGVVRRITATTGSELMLANGVKTGMSEDEVRALMGPLRAEPHVYVDDPAKYLFEAAPNPRVMIEIGAEGDVTEIHVGTMPVLGYVEACS